MLGVQELQAVFGGALAGTGLLVLAAGAQIVLLGDDLIGLELLRPLEVGLGERQLALRLAIDGMGLAQLDAVEAGQRLARLHIVAQVGVDLVDPGRDAGRDMGDAVLIGPDGGGEHYLVGDGLRLQHFDPDAGSLDFLGRELHLPGFAVFVRRLVGVGLFLGRCGRFRFGRRAILSIAGAQQEGAGQEG
ncbi:MAG: hypothetical protein FD131_3395 [Rhodocyclaceae bacterium]|nr:MAG: hypothetical protein FD131_3395 [Rhodocyclaceae bacterium]